MLVFFFLSAAAAVLASLPRCFRMARENRAGTAFGAFVSRVVDGDTIDVVRDGFSSPIRIRLKYVDAPESRQAYGANSTAALDHLLGKHVMVLPYSHDVYGRLLAEVGVSGQSVNLGLVRYGFAWANADAPLKYKSAMRAAQNEGLGLWSGTDIVQPSVYRANPRVAA